MKRNKHGFRRALAILLSAMLLVSGPGLTVFADEAEEDVTIQPDESRTEESGDQTINDQDEDEPAGAEDEAFAEDTFVEEQPVSVVFNVMPQTAAVTVYPASAGEAPRKIMFAYLALIVLEIVIYAVIWKILL